MGSSAAHPLPGDDVHAAPGASVPRGQDDPVAVDVATSADRDAPPTTPGARLRRAASRARSIWCGILSGLG